MAKKVQLKAKTRTGSGRGAARRLRAEGVVPAVIYGAHMKPLNVAVAVKEPTRETVASQSGEPLVWWMQR